jgi:hypothetical protein
MVLKNYLQPSYNNYMSKAANTKFTNDYTFNQHTFRIKRTCQQAIWICYHSIEQLHIQPNGSRPNGFLTKRHITFQPSGQISISRLSIIFVRA